MAGRRLLTGNRYKNLGASMVVAEIRIELKQGVADPEGQNTRKALELLGYEVLHLGVYQFLRVRASKCLRLFVL